MDESQARQQKREQYQAALGIVWKKPDICPICDSTAWNIADLVDVPLRNIEEVVFPVSNKRAYVYAPVTCLYCGYTLFFHTGILDVRRTEEIKTKAPMRLPEGQR